MASSVVDAISGNPYFNAGFGLLGVGTLLAAARQGALIGSNYARRRLLVSLEIPSKDKSYQWFLQWMSKRGGAPRNAHQLSVETKYKLHDNGHVETTFSLVPGPGRHFFKYHNAWFQIERSREKNMVDLHSGTPWETVTLTTLSRDRGLLEKMLADAKQLAIKSQEGKTVIYTAWGAEWKPFGQPRRRRPLQSVVLDQGVSERIVNDVREFISNGQWYIDRGIPYRRGYLLYGPPGSGKSSFIQALAGEIEYNICILNLSERGLTDDKLNHLLTVAPPRSIILLEDIDAAFSKRQQTETQGYQSLVTFSGLLNALDGVASSEERMLFMTTNHIDRLDEALIRPGRVDVKELLDNATMYQIRQMFIRFYNDSDKADVFVDTLKKAELVGRVSTAVLQGHFVVHRNSPARAIETAVAFLSGNGSPHGVPHSTSK